MIDEYYTWIIFGYHSYELKQNSHKNIVVRCDRCCQHRVCRNSAYHDLCQSCGLYERWKKTELSRQRGRNISKTTIYSYSNDGMQIAISCEMNNITKYVGIYTLINKQHHYNGGYVNNPSCATYLGVHISEEVLSRVFKNVERMPNGNEGFDYICGKGYKIDVKSSATGYKGYWHFNINRNIIADHFLLLAFEDRKNDPVHLWLIPGHIVHNCMSLHISKNTVDKWAEYEMVDKLKDVVKCCDAMRNNI